MFNSCLTVGLPTISCKPHLCTSVNNSKAEIPCEVSGTPIPSTKIELNNAGTSVPVDSSRFSILHSDSLMPILTIDPVNCALDAGNNYTISSENILGVSQPYHWNDAHVLGTYIQHLFDVFRYLTFGMLYI